MRKILTLIAILSLPLSVLSTEAMAKKLGAASDVKALSEHAQMKLALSAAPGAYRKGGRRHGVWK